MLFGSVHLIASSRRNLSESGENLKLNAKTWEADFDFDAVFGGNPPQEPPSTTSAATGNGTVVATLATPRPPKSNGSGHLSERDINADGKAPLGRMNGAANGHPSSQEGDLTSNMTEAESLRLQLDQAKAKSKLISSAFD